MCRGSKKKRGIPGIWSKILSKVNEDIFDDRHFIVLFTSCKNWVPSFLLNLYTLQTKYQEYCQVVLRWDVLDKMLIIIFWYDLSLPLLYL